MCYGIQVSSFTWLLKLAYQCSWIILGVRDNVMCSVCTLLTISGHQSPHGKHYHNNLKMKITIMVSHQEI